MSHYIVCRRHTTNVFDHFCLLLFYYCYTCTSKYTNKNTQMHIHNSTKNRLPRFQLATRRAEVFTWENNQPAPPISRSLKRDLGGAGWLVSIPFPSRLSYKHFCYLLYPARLPKISGTRDGSGGRAGSLPYKHPLTHFVKTSIGTECDMKILTPVFVKPSFTSRC